MNRQEKFNRKIQKLRDSVKDNSLMDDLQEISEDFNTVDSEGWPDAL